MAEDELEEALVQVEKLRGEARAAGDEEMWTRALVAATQLQSGLHKVEEAARFLKAQPWPAGAAHRAVLDLYYAEALVRYSRAYSWEIGRRERVDAEGEIPLEQWTREQITSAAVAASREAWSLRQDFGDVPLSRLHPYLVPNNYPAEIRGTMRDALSYLYVELLGSWDLRSSGDFADTGSLDLPSLIRGDAIPADASALHPLREMAAVLGDLEAWHLAAGRREAALEARLTRMRRLHESFTEEEDRRLIRRDLEAHLEAFRDVPWWSMGMATLAELLMKEEPGQFARAHAVAVAGRDAWPDSPGGKRCGAIASEIELPGLRLETMASDGLGRRSLAVKHKHLSSLYFRAYTYDPRQAVDKDLLSLVARVPYVVSWRIELPETPDFDWHTTWVVPPIDRPGAYVVVASSQEDFDSTKATSAAVRILLSDLVLVTRNAGGQEVEVLALSGATGEPVAGAQVRLYGTDRKSGITQIERTEITDASGTLRFPLEPKRAYSLSGEAGGELAEVQVPYVPEPEGPDAVSTLLYTDRAVYRPQQTIHWKVLAYQGSKKEGRFAAQAGQTVTVTLRDAGRQEVASRTVITNGFGTASGEILIPAGRLLGSWFLESAVASQPPDSQKGVARVQVEEYKRPTFEVAIDDPAAPLRLGAPAKLAGRAVYYFGLPVARGQVRWRVVRTPAFPWWWRGSFRPEGGTVASGTSDLGADGTFEIVFTPQPQRQGREELTYRYWISAVVTDGGGETREAERAFRVGRTAIEGWIANDHGFLLAGRPAFLTITRRDLNGVPRPGAGSWSLYELRQPEKALLPAEEPVPDLSERGFHTPGDALSPRWNDPSPPEIVLHGWPDGGRLVGGELRHGAAGEAEVKLPALRPGAYRLRYETLDDSGKKVEAQRELIVAGTQTSLALPAVLEVETAVVRVGGTARLLVHSGLPGQTFFFEVWRGGERIERRMLRSGEAPSMIERAIGRADRGGLGFKLLLLRDHQLFDLTASVQVPWDDRELRVGFATFRDRLRPGARESWRITVRPPVGVASEAAAAEVLATMTDRSLELFAHYELPDPLRLYPDRTWTPVLLSNLGTGREIWSAGERWPSSRQENLVGDRLLFLDLTHNRVSFGPLTMQDGRVTQRIVVTAPSPQLDERQIATGATVTSFDLQRVPSAEDPVTQPERPLSAPAVPVRSNFTETAFWQPHLLTGQDGTATIEFTVPDAVTSWNVFVQAVTRDLRAGTLRREAKSARDLLVRPYLPRFLREGDRAELKAVVTNTRKTEMQGEVAIDVLDPETGESRLADFGLTAGTARLPFALEAGGGTSVTFPLTAPRRLGTVAFEVTAVAGDESDGELRPVPVLPSRVHLAQSRFAVLQGAARRELRFPDLERNDDATRIDEQLVVTVDGQLFQGVLAALPYLVNYPYECTEQTLNRFLSTGIVTSLFDRYPGVARMAADLAKRETPLESWDSTDPNRKLSLEETPFLALAKGGDEKDFIKVLDPRIARAEREASLLKLTKAQLPNGGFPWWPGGPASDYMTAYLLYGFAKAAEFGVDVPRDVVKKGWSYLAQQLRKEDGKRLGESCCLEVLTFVNYVATVYPDPSWMGDTLTDAERRQILDASFASWRDLSPYLRSLLALTLKRMGRPDDARLVFDSVMDRAKTTPEEGTFWQPEERSWLWYHDTIESHAFALRALMELRPDDPRRHGLVQWLFLHKQLSHWESTRATAEVLYSLVHYLQKEGQLGVAEAATVKAGGQTTTFTFAPDRFTGKENRVVISGDKIDPVHSSVLVEKETPGFLFAAATWHFSTDEPVKEGSGDLFHVSRRYFLRVSQGKETVLEPLDEGAFLKPGDEVEVHLAVSSRAPAEYVHLRDPRAAGLEPESLRSGWHWDLGLLWYEETRDSATNFFFENLPAGTYTLKYRLRANLAGEFRVGPATLQSMYAPEFTAYSGGGVVKVKG